MANFYKKSTQLGRSMIEMLGVLAIIGVLSIAGIAAYSKAMRKHNVNQTADIFTGVLRGYATLRENVNNLSGDIAMEDFVNMGIYSECKLVPSVWDGTKACKTPTGDISMEMEGGRVNFYVFLTKDTCAEFLSYNWQNVIPKEWGNNPGYEGIVDGTTYTDRYVSIQVGPDWTPIWGNGVDNYNMQGIAKACNKCKDGEPCGILFAYGGEI